ncbi:MAG TPA: ATP-binding protein [Fimbriimonadaceae bacterium]|nr:ATP-binding protein [Fimbriimonadaceae bacterium]
MRKTTLLFMLAILLIATVDALALWSNRKNRDSAGRGAATQNLIRDANDVSRIITDVEVVSGALQQRPDPSLLVRLRTDRSAIDDGLRRFRRDLGDRTDQDRLVESIEGLVATNDRWTDLVLQNPGIEPDHPNSSEARAAREQTFGMLRSFITSERGRMLSDQTSAAGFAEWSFWTMVVGTMFSLAIGFTGVLLLTREAEQLKVARRETLAAEQKLEDIIQNSPQAISVRDLEGRYILANDPFLKAIKRTREETIGSLEVDLAVQDVTGRTIQLGQEALRTGKSVEALVEYEDEGQPRAFVVSRFPVRDADGVVYGLGGIGTEVTELKRMHRETEEAWAEAEIARAEAQEANQAKSEFLSRVSHELRTPMNSILGFAQLALMQGLNPNIEDQLKRIVRAGRHLLGLIDDVLDIGRIESGEMSLSVEPISVGEAISTCFELVQVSAKEADVDLIHEVPQDCEGVYVMADRQRLRQILLNLLSNAIKYNAAKGHVRVRCVVSGELGRFEVADDGVGIPPDRVDRLFVPFDRLDAAARSIEGTGLGLALSSRLAQSMNGSVGYAPNPDGQGSVFWVEFPLGTPPEIPSDDPVGDCPRPSRPILGDKTILYVEDNLTNVTLVEALLRNRPDLKLIVAMQGRMGLELAREHHPDLILLDLHLPDMDGAEVFAEIRKLDEPKTAPIIVVSADATEKQRQRLLSMGAFAYLTKPFVLIDLIDNIDEALRQA